jgi:drug/metabolite transporter (DMT)-like permease
MLTINPFQFSAYSINALIGLLSAVIAACVAIVLRYLSTRHHTFEIIFYFMAAVTLVPIPMIWDNFVIPTHVELLYLMVLGVIALLGQIFLTRAFSHDCVAVIEIVRYIGIIYNAAWGFLFWNEVPDRTTVIGGIFIIGACIALSYPSSAKK